MFPLVNAFDANFSSSSPFLDLSQNNTINITIGAMSNNITEIEFRYQTNLAGSPLPDLFINSSNGTSATSINFSDNTNYSATITRTYLLNFTNSSGTPIINNGTTKNFWISVAARRMDSGTGALLSLQIKTKDLNGNINTTTISFFPSFAFTGYVLNETACVSCGQNGTNVSIYGASQTQNGPPSSTLLASTMTNASGYFRIARVNASSSFGGFQLKMVYYNATGTATKTGMIMPQFPSFMYYGAGGDGEFDMSLNGATFYLQQAFTINLSANNGTTPVSFGYEIVDQALGFPIESSSQQKTNNVQVVVPASRGYTISFFRMPAFPGSSIGYSNDPACFGTDFMNDSLCPAPPKTYAISAANAVGGNVSIINQSLIIRKVNLIGCLNPASGVNSSPVNVTAINIKMLPWTTSAGSFVPPTRGDDGRINLTQSINYTTTGCPFAFYNISVLNQTGYMLEFYAKNGSVESDNPGSANNLASFINLTSNDELRMNGTLYKLAGTYRTTNQTGLAINTSSIKINVINSSGGAVTTSINANIKVRHTASGIGTVFYMIDTSSISNGSFYLPIFNNSNYAKAMIFSQNGPPKEISLNLSATEINITMTSMSMDKGFKKFNSTGGLDSTNTTSIPIRMRFLRNTPECGMADAPSTCVITEMNASSFNPLKALLAGKVNMELKITSTNVTLIYKDYDMMSAKQPPMESVMGDSADARGTTSGSTAVRDTWNFGSFAPADSYSNVTVIIPYSDTTTASGYINDSAQVNVSIPVLYDENNRVTWNKSMGSDYVNLSDDFSAYNSTYYRGLMNTSGVICQSGGFNETCFKNTTGNYLALNIPHFSTIGAQISGAATTASSDSSSSGSGGGGGGGGNGYHTYSITQYQLDSGYNKVLYAYDKIRMNISGQYHNVMLISISSSGATINVSSTPQQKVFAIGEKSSFDVTDDGKKDIEVKLEKINSTSGWANVTVTRITTTNNSIVPQNQTNNNAQIPQQPASKGVGAGTLSEEKIISSSTWWTIGIIVTIIVLAIIVALLITKYQQYKENKNSRKVRVYGNLAK